MTRDRRTRQVGWTLCDWIAGHLVCPGAEYCVMEQCIYTKLLGSENAPDSRVVMELEERSLLRLMRDDESYTAVCYRDSNIVNPVNASVGIIVKPLPLM